MVLMDGTVVELGGGHLDAGGRDLWRCLRVPKGQWAFVTEATFADLRKPEGARPVLIGFNDQRRLRALVCRDSFKEGVAAVAIEFHGSGLLYRGPTDLSSQARAIPMRAIADVEGRRCRLRD